MNHLLNHEAVYRTAPATPGLLITHNFANYFRAPSVGWLLSGQYPLPVIQELAVGDDCLPLYLPRRRHHFTVWLSCWFPVQIRTCDKESSSMQPGR